MKCGKIVVLLSNLLIGARRLVYVTQCVVRLNKGELINYVLHSKINSTVFQKFRILWGFFFSTSVSPILQTELFVKTLSTVIVLS